MACIVLAEHRDANSSRRSRTSRCVHNPFPQLSKIAIAPFFNLSTEPTVDGRQFAQAYFNELQSIQGFEVVPVGVVERAMDAYQLDLDNPDEVRKLATVLGVDAVVDWGGDRLYALLSAALRHAGRMVRGQSLFPADSAPAMVCRGARPRKNRFRARWCSKPEFALARAQLKTQTPPYPVGAGADAATGALPTPAGDGPMARSGRTGRPLRCPAVRFPAAPAGRCRARCRATSRRRPGN